MANFENGRTLRTPSHGIRAAGPLALGLVALEEARHEELLRQRRQPHAAGLAVLDQLVGLIGIDDLDHRARRRRVVDDRVVVRRVDRDLVRRQTHQRVAVGRREVDPVEQFLDGEAMELRRHLGAAAEHALDPHRFSDTFSHSASSSFGVVNRHWMPGCARSSVSAWSMTWRL